MAGPTYVAGATANDGQTSGTTTAAITIPATAQAGDTAVVTVVHEGGAATFTPPSGWTSLHGNDVNSSSTIDCQVWVKDLVSGDPGSSVTFSCSTGGRFPATMDVFRGTAASLVTVSFGTVTTAATSITTPTLATTVDNTAILTVLLLRSSTTTATTITTPGTGTAAATAKTAFAATPQLTNGSFYRTTNASPTGTYGGISVTVSPSSTANIYTIGLPPASSAFSGSASFSGSGTLSTVDTPKPATSVALSGSGTLAASGTPNPGAAAAFSSSGTLNAQPGTKWQASSSGTLAVTVSSVDLDAAASFGGNGIFQAIAPVQVALTSVGVLSVVPTAITVTGASAVFDGSEGQLQVTGEGFRHCFTGPVVYDYRPLEKAYPQLLTIWIPYGTTVWLDASGGWHNKFWPTPEDLAGAQYVFPGGRCNDPTPDELVALQASPYAAYLHMEKIE